MTTTRNFAINTRWGHANHRTSTLHRHTKLLNPSEIYLFHLLPQDILTDIDIWLSRLDHCEKFKAFITNMNTMCNPTLLSIAQDLWAPYHNFSVYSGCYNECFYAWAHRRVPTNTRLCYQLFGSYSTVISTLNQQHINLHKSVVACQLIPWDENSSIPYFRQTILDSYIVHHATCNSPIFRGW